MKNQKLKNLVGGGSGSSKYLAIAGVLLALVLAGALVYQNFFPAEPEAPVVEQPEALSDWKTYRNEEYGFEFRYPEQLDAEYVYIHSSTWPPEISVSPTDPSFVCEKIPGLKPKSDYTEQPYIEWKEVVVNNTTFCVALGGGAAAGTTYTNYRYVANKNSKQVIVEFTLKYPNCGNFDGPLEAKGKECSAERLKFDPNLLAHQILSTLRFIE